MIEITKSQLELFFSHSNAIEGEPFEFDEGTKMAWEYIMEKGEISPSSIKKMHSFLMKGKNLFPKYRGEFRDVPIYIAGEKRDNQDTIEKEIEVWAMNGTNVDPLVSHYLFEKTHPFIDGNGRLGRLLCLYITLARGDDLFYFNSENRQDYYKMFEGEGSMDRGLFTKPL